MSLETIFAALFALLLGLAFCFWGYRVFLVMLPIWGFVGGFWLGAEGVTLLLGEGFLATTTSWVVGLIAGFFGAIFSYAFFWVGIIFFAGVLGAGLATGALEALGIGSTVLLLVAGIVAFVAVALLALRHNVQRPLIEALTAVFGAALVTLAPLLLFGMVTPDELRVDGNAVTAVLGQGLVWIALWLGLAVAGFLFQYRTHAAFTFGKEDYVQGWG